METLSEREQHGSPDEPCASAVSVDEIVALEDRIQRTSELVRNLCRALMVADERAAQSEIRAAQTEEWALNAEAHVRAYAPRLEQMQNELSVLRGERDNVRQRVEDLLAEVHGYTPMVEQMQVTLKSGAFWPLVEIDIAVGVIGCLAAISWGRSAGREMDRDTVLFLCKMFGGISLGFLVIILVMAFQVTFPVRRI